MKKANLILLFSFILIATACRSQQLVQKTSDAQLLQQYKERFVGKPLKDLIKEIKPIIVNVNGTLGKVSEMPNASVGLAFVTLEEYRTARKAGKNPVLISIGLVKTTKVYVTPNPVDSLGRTWNERLITDYGDIIIRDINVGGDD